VLRASRLRCWSLAVTKSDATGTTSDEMISALDAVRASSLQRPESADVRCSRGLCEATFHSSRVAGGCLLPGFREGKRGRGG